MNHSIGVLEQDVLKSKWVTEHCLGFVLLHVCVCVWVAKSACQTRGLNYMPTHKVLYSESTASVNNLHPDLDLASQEIVTILNETESKPLADVSQRAVFRTA